MVHRAERAYLSPILHRHMAAECGRIRQDHMVPNATVVRDVSVCHDQHMVPYAGQTAAFYGSAIDGDELTDFVVVADFEPGRLSGITQVLRGQADGGKGKEGIVRPDFCGTLDGDVGHQFAAFSQLHVRAHHTIRSNLAAGRNFRAGVEDGGGMDAHRHGSGAGRKRRLRVRSRRSNNRATPPERSRFPLSFACRRVQSAGK